MAKRKKYRRERKIRGKGKPDVLENKFYFVKKQVSSGVVTGLLGG